MTAYSVVSLSGFPTGAIVWEPEPGQRSLTVIVKATFALAPGDVTLANEQDALREERHWDDNVLASLHDPGDFAPSKRRVDVTLVGHAYAPRGQPATSLVARLGVGDLVKSVRVSGDRRWTKGPGNAAEPGAPAPFVRMPLRYERAVLSADNPVGIDPHAPPAIAGPALPNLERADEGGGTPCFGPVAPTWRARRRLLDEAASFWAHAIGRDPRSGGPPPGPAPSRFDFAFFNAAPADQQLDLLRPGTAVVLDNLHPRHERLETRLPAVRPQVFRVPPDGPNRRVEEIILRCDSLWIDTDRAVVVLTWRGLADLGADADAIGTLVSVADPGGKKLRFASIEKRLGEATVPTMRLGPDGLPPVEEPEPAPPPDLLARRHDAVKLAAPAVPVATAPEAESQAAPAANPLEIDDDTTTEALDAPGEDERTVEVVPKAAPARPAVRTSGLALRKDLTLERCAEIAAALAMPNANRAALLRARMLTEASWTLVDQHWKKAMSAEAELGERAIADVFDEAYVHALEHLPEPIGLFAYARLAVAVERGEVGRVLSELELELGAVVRLQRVWSRRAAASPELAAALERAMGQARRAGA